MAKKLPLPIPATALDLEQKLRSCIKRARSNDGTRKAMDGGNLTLMELAVAMVLWPLHKCLENAGINSPLKEKKAIGDDLWAAVEIIRHESRIADIEKLVRQKEDGNTRGARGGRVPRGHAWVEAVVSVEAPKRPDDICSKCRIQIGGNAASCMVCHEWVGRWRAIEEVRSMRTKIRTKLEPVLMKHKFPLAYLDRIANLPKDAGEFHELAMLEQARTKGVRDEGERNLKTVKSLRLALQGFDELKSVFRQHGVCPTDLLRKLPRIETDLAAEIARVIEPTAARQFVLQMLSIQHTRGAPVTADGRQRDYAIDALSTIWVEVHGNEPSVHPTSGGSTAFVELLKGTFRALGRSAWVRGAERAAARVKRERRAWKQANVT